ncbi:hypothetical protein ILUMI_21609 [Ignelater luminosus]|uniref:Neprilysin n=1 Tax=Ignelater luminosus TaxID=2038154 RepID=A0A8K0CBS7_IGNLU|nr:hypothetical protein ILUMI_21609 [Ignelater luminosus]
MNVNIDYSRNVRQNKEESNSWWGRRSKLETYLCLALIFLLASSGGLFAYITLNRKMEPKICITQDCLLAASEIISFIKPQVDPCEDFFQFSCGKFIQDMHGDIEAASQFDLEELAQSQLKEIIEEPINEDDHFLIKDQKELFQACMNESGIQEKSLDIFEQMLEEIDGWPVVVSHHWLAKRFDWKDMIYELRNRGYEYNMLLRVTVGLNTDDSNQFVIMITGPFHMPIIENRDLYKNYMIEVAKTFGAHENLAKNEMEDVLVFIEKLKEIVTNFKFETLTVQEFQNKHNQTKWLEFINMIISPVEGISSEDSVKFPGSKFIDEFFHLMKRTQKRTQANYIIWSVIESIMPFLPKEIRQINTNYICSLNLQLDEPTDRFDQCGELVERSMFYPKSTDIIYTRKYLPVEKKEEIEEIYESIKTELASTLEETSWLDQDGKENLLEKANSINVAIGYEDDYFNDTIFEKFEAYKEEENNDGDNSFLNKYLQVSKQTANILYSLIYIPANETLYEGFAQGIVYHEIPNALIIKATALQGILYNKNRPTFMNYGTLGFKIGEQLIYGIDISDEDNMNKTKEEYNKHLECFEQKLGGFDLDDRKDMYIKGNLQDSAGTKLAYRAYQNWILKNTKEPQLPGIYYNPNQLFWVSTMLPKCHRLIGENLEEEIFKATAPMRHSWEFARDFECPTDSKMNPSEKCEVY